MLNVQQKNNPKKRKKNYKRFITAWLSREEKQDMLSEGKKPAWIARKEQEEYKDLQELEDYRRRRNLKREQEMQEKEKKIKLAYETGWTTKEEFETQMSKLTEGELR